MLPLRRASTTARPSTSRPVADPATSPRPRIPTAARHAAHHWRRAMTPDQVSGLFDAGEGFIEGTIAAALVVLWLLALALHLGRGYMVRTTGKFTLRLGADLWWIIYVGLRDLIVRPGLHRQLHLLLPGRRVRPGPADHRRPRRGLRVRGPADQAHPPRRRDARPSAGSSCCSGSGRRSTSCRTSSASR